MANENQDVEKLRAEVTQLRNDLQDITGTLREMATQRGEQTYEQLRGHANTARERVVDTERAIEKQIEERPMTSIFLSFFGGLMAGLILQQSRR